MLDAWPSVTAHPWPLPATAAACGVVAALWGRTGLLAPLFFGALTLGCAAGAAGSGGVVRESGRAALGIAGAATFVAAVTSLPSAIGADVLGLRLACGLVIVACTAAGIEVNRCGPWRVVIDRLG